MNKYLYEKLSKIVATALSQKELNGIEELLKIIVNSVDAAGCILWVSEPYARLDKNTPSGSLYVFADWFCKELKVPIQKLPIDKSANGNAIITEKPINIEDFRTHPLTFKTSYLVDEIKLTSMHIVPITFDSKGKKNASLSIYRTNKVKVFTSEEQEFIQAVAELIPQLYQSICETVEINLLSRINIILDKIEDEIKNQEDEIYSFNSIETSFNEVSKALSKICKKISQAFQCVETSLFFENWFDAKHTYKRMGTSYPDWSSDEKSEYLPQKKEGLTAWTLAEQKPLRIFNLLTFHDDKERIRLQYKDVTWKDSLNFKSRNFQNKIKDLVNLPPKSDLPALSFMAVPVTRGKDLLGVIRCSTSNKAPYFFPKLHLKILESIAIPISRFWNDFLIHLEEREETKSWKNLIGETNQLNNTVQKHIISSDLNKDLLYRKILSYAKKYIGADIVDIRLTDDSSKELKFVSGLGKAWSRRKVGYLKKKNKRFSLNQKENSKIIVGVEVFKSGKAQKIDNYKSETFPETKSIIVAPIGVQEQSSIGVLTIRSTEKTTLPPNALIMAELLGHQLGLYLSLLNSDERQRQVFEDIWHQMKGPVRHTFKRANQLVRDVNDKLNLPNTEAIEILEDDLLKLRGVSRKAKRVAINASVFKDLASKNQIMLPSDKKKILASSEIVKMIIETGIDTRLMLEEEEDVKFSIFKSGFKKLDLPNINVKASFDLLEQAINCLLDNAGKYSFTNTLVTITAKVEVKDTNQYFYISVKNKGFEIGQNESNRLKKRYYRGRWAKKVTGEGSGIGLWVVDHIMQAHNGKLEIFGTNLSGDNIVNLVFPINT